MDSPGDSPVHTAASFAQVIKYNTCINACIITIQVPRAHEVRNQRVIAKRTSQIMKHGRDVIILKWTDDNIQDGKWY